MLVHILLVLLQLTVLQWQMQVAQAMPSAGSEPMADCLMQGHGGTQAGASGSAAQMDDCCSGYMSLACQYHCSVGGFAFLSALPIGTQPVLMAPDFPHAQTSPETLVVGSLFRPPRDTLA